MARSVVVSGALSHLFDCVSRSRSFTDTELAHVLCQSARFASENCLKHERISSWQSALIEVDIHVSQPVAQRSGRDLRAVRPLLEGQIAGFNRPSKRLTSGGLVRCD